MAMSPPTSLVNFWFARTMLNEDKIRISFLTWSAMLNTIHTNIQLSISVDLIRGWLFLFYQKYFTFTYILHTHFQNLIKVSCQNIKIFSSKSVSGCSPGIAWWSRHKFSSSPRLETDENSKLVPSHTSLLHSKCHSLTFCQLKMDRLIIDNLRSCQNYPNAQIVVQIQSFLKKT